jgi:hypothetical protein
LTTTLRREGRETRAEPAMPMLRPSVALPSERRPPQSSWVRGVKPVRRSTSSGATSPDGISLSRQGDGLVVGPSSPDVLSDEALAQAQALLAWSRSL